MIIRYHAIVAALLLSGCTVGPDYQRPSVAVPKQWHQAATVSVSARPDKWWQAFHDPILNRLMSEAIAANLDLKQALIHIKDARAQRAAIFAAALPSATAKSSVSRRLNNVTSSSQSGGTSGGFGIGNQLITIFQSGFDAQWELDFFGGIKRTAENADAAVDSEIENSRDVLVTLLGDVAKNYIELRASQQELAITRKLLLSQQETQNLTAIRQQSGLINSLEVTQAQAQAATTAAQLPVYERNIQLSVHTLSLLLDQEPGALAIKLTDEQPIPSISEQLIPDLPSELLKRRPDIRRAERQMAAASASIGIATAELYPKINLSAFLGLQNTHLTDVTPLGKSWSTAASLSVPIFNWGRLKANIKSKETQFDAAFLTYQATVLGAFKEVEDALVAHRKEQTRYLALTDAMTANQLAIQLAEERYQKGMTSLMEVLQSQQASYQTESTLIDSAASLSNQRVALYKALGGGWQSEPRVSDVCRDCEKNLAEHIHDYTKTVPH